MFCFGVLFLIVISKITSKGAVQQKQMKVRHHVNVFKSLKSMIKSSDSRDRIIISGFKAPQNKLNVWHCKSGYEPIFRELTGPMGTLLLYSYTL